MEAEIEVAVQKLILQNHRSKIIIPGLKNIRTDKYEMAVYIRSSGQGRNLFLRIMSSRINLVKNIPQLIETVMSETEEFRPIESSENWHIVDSATETQRPMTHYKIGIFAIFLQQ